MLVGDSKEAILPHCHRLIRMMSLITLDLLICLLSKRRNSKKLKKEYKKYTNGI
jgi:hypothetical protein